MLETLTLSPDSPRVSTGLNRSGNPFARSERLALALAEQLEQDSKQITLHRATVRLWADWALRLSEFCGHVGVK